MHASPGFCLPSPMPTQLSTGIPYVEYVHAGPPHRACSSTLHVLVPYFIGAVRGTISEFALGFGLSHPAEAGTRRVSRVTVFYVGT